ncbi:MAG: phosphoglycolate phosphatase [Pseudomonadota bacterium]|jgi:phosphoglycolate phosphatase
MPLPAGLQAAIIDLDGTLIDTVGDFEAALGAMLRDLRLPTIERAFIQNTVGKGTEHLIRCTLAQVNADAGRFDQALALYMQHYLDINGRYATVYPGVPEGLLAMKERGLRLACVTNKPTALAEPLLERKGLRGYFEVVFGGDAFVHKKPHPEPLLNTCAVLGTTPAQTLMVGDSSNDAQAARAAGCPVVLMSYGYNHGEPVHGLDLDGVYDRLDGIIWPRAC